MAALNWTARNVARVASDTDDGRAGKPNPATGCDRRPNRACEGCPQANTPEHQSYSYGWPTAALAGNERYRISTVLSMRHAVWRVGRMLHGLMGWTRGFLYNAEASLNFADRQVWFYAVSSPTRLALVLQSLGDPRNVVIASARIREPEVGLSTFPRNYYGVAVQPGDIVEFDPPSCLAGKCRPMVVSIHSFDPETNIVVVNVDQDISNALHSTDRGGVETMVLHTCKTWRESGSPENWERVTPAIPHKGKQRRIRVERSAIPSHGRVSLTRSDGAACAIAVPRLADPARDIAQSFRVLAIEADGSQTDITATCLAGGYRSWRLKTTTNTLGLSSTVLCLGTKDHADQNVFASLLGDRIAFQIDYVAEATTAQIAAGDFEVWGYDRCRYAVRDWSGTIGLLRDSETGGTNGGWYCSKAMTVTRTPILNGAGLQTGETVSFAPIEAGPRFPSGGRCAQCGTCAGFAPLEYSDEANHKPFGIPLLGKLLREIWNGVSVRWDQLMPGLAHYRNIVVKRPADGHTSLSELAGMPQLYSWPGMFPRRDFPRNRSVVADCTTVENDTGTRLKPIRGAWWNLDHPFPLDYEHGKQEDFPAAGHYGTEVASWATVRDPLGGTLTATTDLSESYKSQLPRQDTRVVRDSGEVENPGLANYGRANADDGYLLAPRIPLRPGTYDRDDVLVTINAEPANVMGFLAKVAVQIRPARTFRKTESVSVEATVHSAVMSGDTCTIEISPAIDQWSFVDGPPRFRFDNVRKVLAGGNFCDAPDWEKNLDNYANNKSLGAQHRARRGDYVSFGPGADLEAMRFPILTARAHAGGSLPNWGDDQRRLSGRLSGYFEPDEANATIGTDPITGEPLLGVVAVRPEYRAPDAPDASATTIRLVLQGSTTGRSLGVGARLRNAVTGEMFTATAATFTANSPEVTITATRGQFGTAAAAIGATDAIFWETVTNSTTGTPFVRIADAARPSLAANEYWQDPISGILVFGSAATVLVQYAVLGDPDTPSTSSAYAETFTIPAAAQMPLGITWTEYNNKTANVTSGWADPDAPGTGPLSIQNVADNAVLQAPIRDAGAAAFVQFDFDGPAETPGRWSHASGGTAYAKKRDKITLRDNHARHLAEIAPLLAGKTIRCHINAGVFFDDLTEGHKVEWCLYRQEEWTECSGEVKADGGRGIVWLDQAAYDSIVSGAGGESLVCLRVR